MSLGNPTPTNLDALVADQQSRLGGRWRTVIGALVGAGIAFAAYALPVDPKPRYGPNASGGIDVTFDAVAGQTYFIETSTDLEHWTTLNYWTLGTGTPVTWSLTTSEANTFWRVWTTDHPVSPEGVLMTDFNGNGILSGAELAAGTNPVDEDPDRDGLSFSEEALLQMNGTIPAVKSDGALCLAIVSIR